MDISYFSTLDYAGKGSYTRSGGACQQNITPPEVTCGIVGVHCPDQYGCRPTRGDRERCRGLTERARWGTGSSVMSAARECMNLVWALAVSYSYNVGGKARR
jgi:hypothetical protein